MKQDPALSTIRPFAAWHLMIPFVILLLVSLACSVPTLGQVHATQPMFSTLPAATPTRTAAPAVTPVSATPGPAVQSMQATPAVKLPPALVEVEPLPDSEIAPNAAPVFYFNQPMERASVESSLKTQPSLSGRFEWLNDSSVRYIPDKPISTTIHMTIDKSAKAANGLALAQPVQVSYQAAGPLALAERLPAPNTQDVNPASAVVVTFTRPVVALGGDAQNLPSAFTLEPAANGRGEWLNTSTYIYYPQPALKGGAQYTVHLNKDLKSVDGGPLADKTETEWHFTTASPVLLKVTPSTEQPVLLDSTFTLTFNQPMDPSSVQSGFSLVGSGGEVVQGPFTWNAAGDELTFKPVNLLQRGAAYTLTVSGSAASQGGATLGKDFTASLITVPQFAVTQTRPTAGEALAGYGGYSTIMLTFSSPVASGQDLNSLVTLSPPIAGQSSFRDPDGFQLYISGYFMPSASYSLSVSPDLMDRWNAKLGTPFSFTFSTQSATPGLVIPIRASGSLSLFVPVSETSIPAQSTNITSVNLSRGKLSLKEFIQADANGSGLENWAPKVESSWTLPLNTKQNTSTPVNIPITQDGSTLAPGLYFLNIDAQPKVDQYTPPPEYVIVSPIHMVFKTSARQAFIWAVKLPDNTPVAGMPVTIYDNNAAVLGTCTTGDDGTCQVDLPVHQEAYKALYAVHGQPGDAEFSLAAWNWSNGVAPWEFSLPYQDKGFQPEVYLYTDRPIYRPGQTVNFRAIVRSQDNGRYGPPPLKQLTVDVVSPYDPLTGQSQTITTLRLPLDPLGSASAAYTLPDDARTGSYSLRLQEVPFKVTNFEVAAYRKPEIDLQVKFSQADVQTGSDLQAQVTARYFFGAPAGNLTAHWTLLRTPGYLSLPDGLTAGKLDPTWLPPWNYFGGSPYGMSDLYVMDGQAQLATDGTAMIDIPNQTLMDHLGTTATDLQNLKLEVTMQDESGLPVSARDSMRLHPSPFYVGVRAEQWTVEMGQEITYYIRSVDWQGKPVADKQLTARFRKVVWVPQNASDSTMLPDYLAQYTDIGSTDFRTSAEGEARVAFTPPEPGTYILEVTSPDGADTQQLTWVGGPGSAVWPKLPNQHILLRADADHYQAGQTAHIFIPNPYPDGALALVTVERAKVMRSQVLPIQGANYDLALPLSDADAPDVYVSVTLLGRSNNRPDFRAGYVQLAVDPAAQLLNVSIDPGPQQAQPGGEITLTIRVKDAQGSPVQGEFSLALIDKAVLALADPNSPTIMQAFYGSQPLGVQSSLGLAIYGGRFIVSPPGRGGGGGGDMAAVPPVRTNFADTAYWNGNIQTDATGATQVTIKLPDNLTTWVADVRGLTGDTRVGQATLDLVATKPLLIRPVAPRFVVAGDHIQMAAVVNNNTQAALKASVRLESAGFSLDDPNQAAQPVDIPAGDRRQVIWWGTVQNVPSLDLTFSVDAGDLHDAAHPELSPLPVLSYSAPQTFGTTGMLAEAGEQTELVSLPRSFTPTGGSLSVELSPSLSAAVLDGLKALDAYPQDITEPVTSRLLANLSTLQATKDLQLGDDTLHANLTAAINLNTERLVQLQNQDGGWSWSAGTPVDPAMGVQSDPYLTSYALLGLTQAAKSGVFVDTQVIQKAQAYLLSKTGQPTMQMEGWQASRLAFQNYALQQSGRMDLNLNGLYDFRAKLSPWAKATLALTLQGQAAGDQRARTLISDLEASASRSATGANWQDSNPAWYNWSTPNFTTAIVVDAIAQLDPTSRVLVDAARYLALNRYPKGDWASSYETAWVIQALTQVARASGDTQSSYAFSASLNASPVVNGKVENLAQAANIVTTTIPLASLNPDMPNMLTIQHGPGTGSLYYRAFLQVNRPAQDAEAINRGLSLTRQYYRAGQDCRKVTCQPLDSLSLADQQPVQVRLTLTVPEDMYYVVVEDAIPAGTEVLNPRLKTSQQSVVPDQSQNQGQTQPQTQYDLSNPFDQGWGWWLFSDPQVYDDHVRWVVDYLPAGTYELTYRLTPFLAGDFSVIPAHAWQYYFPDVEGTSKGSRITIK